MADSRAGLDLSWDVIALRLRVSKITSPNSSTSTGRLVVPEAVRESLQRMWESCLPRRKIHRPRHNQYFMPDLGRPVFVRKAESVRSRVRNLMASRKLDGRMPQPTTHEVLYWRTCRKT